MPQHAKPWFLLITVLFGTLLVGIDKTVTNLAIPHIIAQFQVNASTAGWTATSYIITSAVFIPVFGKLGDMFGDRRIFVGGMVGFIITSLITALAWNIPVLIAFRALQGVCAASIVPTAMAAVAKEFTEKSARAQALGFLATTNAGAATVAPLLGGPLIDHFGWRSVFFINLPLGLLAVVLGMIYIHNDQVGKKQHFDVKGSILLGLSLTALVLVVDRGSSWGWASLGAAACYLGMVGFMYLFILEQNRAADPIVDLKIFKNPTTTSALCTTFFVGMSLLSVTLLISLFAQQNLHYSATQTGYLYLPMTIPLILLSPLGARISAWLPPRFAITIGLLGATVGIYLLSRADISLGIRAIAMPMAVFGAFWAITSSPLSTVIANSVPKSRLGMVSGLRSLTLNIGGAIGIALASSLYARDLSRGMSAASTFHTLYTLFAVFLLLAAGVALAIREKSSDYV
jgi:EmrB/QacA subfamily drug resistance transporter